MAGQVVVFTAAGELYALPVEVVREVVATAPRRGLPQPPEPWVAGLASIRGELMPVVDLALRLGAGPTPPDRGVLLVLEARARANAKLQRVAVAVDEVDRIAEPPEILPAPPFAGDAAAGIFERDGVLVLVLRPAALLPAAGSAAPRRRGAPRSRPD